MPKLMTTSAIATTAASAGTTGIVVQYGSLLIIDPVLIGLGIIGFIAAYFWYPNRKISIRVVGFIVGILLANFSSLGFAEFIIEKGFTFLNPHFAAVIFGFSGASIVELWDKWLKKKADDIDKGLLTKNDKTVETSTSIDEEVIYHD